MIRILHLADLHLGWRPKGLAGREADRQAERDALLTRAVDWALRPGNEIDLVIIAGDLFDTHRPPEGLAYGVLRDLGRLVQAGLHVVTVPGNHDEITYHDSVYRVHAAAWPGRLVQNANPERVETREIRGVPCHFYGLAYVGGITRTDPPIDAFPRGGEPGLHIAAFHGSLDWAVGDRSLPLRSEALAQAGYDYVALGHIHRHEQHRLARGLAVYAGAIEGKGFYDPGVRHFTVVGLGGGPPAVEAVPAEARPILSTDFDITDLAAKSGDEAAASPLDELAASLRELANPAAIQRIRLTGIGGAGFPPDVQDRLWERLNQHFYHVEIEDATEPVPPDAAARWAGEPTVRGLFVRRMQRSIAEASQEHERARLSRALWRGLAALRTDAGR